MNIIEFIDKNIQASKEDWYEQTKEDVQPMTIYLGRMEYAKLLAHPESKKFMRIQPDSDGINTTLYRDIPVFRVNDENHMFVAMN